MASGVGWGCWGRHSGTAVSLPAGAGGTGGNQLQHKADLPEIAQPKDHTGHVFVYWFSSTSGSNPLPMGKQLTWLGNVAGGP